MRHSKAITPVAAALLMIVVSVAAFALLFAYTMAQVHRVAPEMIPHIEINIETSKANFKNLTIYARNTGDSPVTIDYVYLLNATTNTVEYAHAPVDKHGNPIEVTIQPGEVKNITIPLTFGLKPTVYKILVSTKEKGKVEITRRPLSVIPAEAVSPLVLNIKKCIVNRGYIGNCCTILIEASNSADKNVELKDLIIWSWDIADLHESFWGNQSNGGFDYFAGAPGEAWWNASGTWINETQLETKHLQIPVGGSVELLCCRLGYGAFGNYSFLDPFSPEGLVKVKAKVLYDGTVVETSVATQGVLVEDNWFEPNPRKAYPYIAYGNGLVKMSFRNHASEALTELYMYCWNYDQNKTYKYQNFTTITINPGSSRPPSSADQYNTLWSLVKTPTGRIKVSPTGEGAWLNLTSWLPAGGIPAATDFSISFTLDPPPTQGSFIYVFLVARFQDQTEYLCWCFTEVISS